MDDISSTKDSDKYKFTSSENLNRKSDTGKASVVFEDSEKRTETPEEVRNEEENARENDRKQRKKERPTSAVCSWNKGLLERLERCAKMRPGSSPEKLSLEDEGQRGCVSPGPPSEGPGALWDYFGFPSPLHRKCRSSCEFSRVVHRNWEKMPRSERDFQKVPRSLRLLGFDPSELGVLSGRTEIAPRWKRKRSSSTFSTKVSCRSVSLDSLRESVREAWLNDRLDESHRKLLSQAVYEEWYFAKEREIRAKRSEERRARNRTKERLRADFERKKEKSEEEFQKWLRRKKSKRKRQEAPLLQKKEKPFTRLRESVEKSEKAFQNWKKAKEREMQRVKMQKRKEEEKKKESEKQKAERKLIAEKAFQQWKKKLEDNERKKEAKKEIKKRKHEMDERRKRAEESQVSFEMWKKAKDEQIKRAIQHYRETAKAQRDERSAQMEERMYEAEQAFEEWLEKVDLRKQKQYSAINPCNMVPWIPA